MNQRRGQLIQSLLLLKKESDRRNYTEKHRLATDLIRKNPGDFEIDSRERDVVGVTHRPSGFRFHLPREVATPLFQKTGSDFETYLQESGTSAEEHRQNSEYADDLIPQPDEDPIEIRDSDIEGKGAFVTKPVKRGESFALALDRELHRTIGARYTNHASDPNVVFDPAPDGCYFKALRDIPEDTELTMDYGDPLGMDKEASDEEWIGVDLDGTLAKYDGWKGPDVIGAPIQKMVDRVKRYIGRGKKIKIFTARVAGDNDGVARRAIKKWCREHLGMELQITCIKDQHCREIWDDIAKKVYKNTGNMQKKADLKKRLIRKAELTGSRGRADFYGRPHPEGRDWDYHIFEDDPKKRARLVRLLRKLSESEEFRFKERDEGEHTATAASPDVDISVKTSAAKDRIRRAWDLQEKGMSKDDAWDLIDNEKVACGDMQKKAKVSTHGDGPVKEYFVTDKGVDASYATVKDNGDYSVVGDIHTDPHFRGKGFADKLLKQIVKDNKKKTLALRAGPFELDENLQEHENFDDEEYEARLAALISLYRKHGFLPGDEKSGIMPMDEERNRPYPLMIRPPGKVQKVACGDMLQYFKDNPKKYEEWQERQKKKQQKEASSGAAPAVPSIAEQASKTPAKKAVNNPVLTPPVKTVDVDTKAPATDKYQMKYMGKGYQDRIGAYQKQIEAIKKQMMAAQAAKQKEFNARAERNKKAWEMAEWGWKGEDKGKNKGKVDTYFPLHHQYGGWYHQGVYKPGEPSNLDKSVQDALAYQKATGMVPNMRVERIDMPTRFPQRYIPMKFDPKMWYGAQHNAGTKSDFVYPEGGGLKSGPVESVHPTMTVGARGKKDVSDLGHSIIHESRHNFQIPEVGDKQYPRFYQTVGLNKNLGHARHPDILKRSMAYMKEFEPDMTPTRTVFKTDPKTKERVKDADGKLIVDSKWSDRQSDVAYFLIDDKEREVRLGDIKAWWYNKGGRARNKAEAKKALTEFFEGDRPYKHGARQFLEYYDTLTPDKKIKFIDMLSEELPLVVDNRSLPSGQKYASHGYMDGYTHRSERNTND